ncbi:unknown protein [Microcystis aeruginosa NIES-843]|nr:unknown protein [Microcystis aeruginosa NIES-843]
MLTVIFKLQLYIIFLNDHLPNDRDFLPGLIAKIYCRHYLINHRFSFINCRG